MLLPAEPSCWPGLCASECCLSWVLLFLEIRSQLQGLAHFCLPTNGLQVWATMPVLFIWVLGTEHRSSCLQDKHLTGWIISPAPNISFLWRYQSYGWGLNSLFHLGYCIWKVPVSKDGPVLRCWGLRLRHVNRGVQFSSTFPHCYACKSESQDNSNAHFQTEP